MTLAESVLPQPRKPLGRRLIDSQVRWASRLDGCLPRDLAVDGNRDFLVDLVPRYLTAGMLIYDVGGGRTPVIAQARKRCLGLTVAGLDIEADQLRQAPAGSYDRYIEADIQAFSGAADADLVISQALLEHVKDTQAALTGISKILKPGCRALIFSPSRNAVYARLNLLLPERLKRWLIRRVFPEMERNHGFPAYYDRCTPKQIEQTAHACGLVVEERRLYFQSSYFSCFFPVHAAWRLWVLLFRLAAANQAAETFAYVFRKPMPGEPR